MTDTTIAIIQGIITVLSAGGVAVVLRQQIKSQQEQINSMKATIESMTAYNKIFDVKKVEEYGKMLEHSALIKAEKVSREIIDTSLDSEDMKSKLSDAVLKLPISKNYLELFFGISGIVLCVPKEKREKYIKSNFPQAGEKILWLLNQIDEEDLDALEEKQQRFLEAVSHQPQAESKKNSGS